MRNMIILLMLLPLFLRSTHATEWDCTGLSNTGTFQRSTDCTISATDTSINGGGVSVRNTLEIVGTVQDMNHLIVITAPSKQRHFYINGVNNKLILRYVKLTGGDVSSNPHPAPATNGGSICIWKSGGTLHLYASIIANNKAVHNNYGYGGGIFALGDENNINAVRIQLNQTVVSNNEASGGGGYFLQYSTSTMVSTTISDNIASNGGELSSLGLGGGISIYDSHIIIRSSIIKNNQAYSGGGFYVKSTESFNSKITLSVDVRQTTFSANIATGMKGNEIYTDGSRTSIYIVNTLFSHSIDSNYNFHEENGLAVWNTCRNNVCTENPFIGACTAVNNANTKYGVLCHCSNTCIKECSPGTQYEVKGAEPGWCNPCDANYYSTDGLICKPCSGSKVSPPSSPKCYDMEHMLRNVQSLSEQQGGIIKAVALSNAKSNEVKQKANGLIAKLSLNWATQDVINEAQILRDKLATLPEYNVTHHCEQEKERLAYGVLRAASIVPSDAEIDDKYCLNENRDRLISSFCNFRPRFIKLLEEKLYPRLPSIPKYTGRDLWPNICCRKDNFQHLKTCNDPSGKVPRSHIVPFALAQGGNITVDNLYGEILDVLKKDGYLQQGMNKAVNGIKDGDKLQQKVNNLFETTLLCGPREFGLPTNEAIRLCELFYPYEHMLATYYNEVNALLEPLQRRRRRRLLGVWPSIRDGFTNLINSASEFMLSKDENNNRDDDSGSEMQKLEDKMEMLTKSNAMLMNEVKQSRNKINRLEKKDAISRHEIQDLKQKDAVLEKKDAVLEKKDAVLEKKDAISDSNIKNLKQQANKTNTFLSILKRNGISKRRLGSASDALCQFVTMSDVSEYEKDIDTFCTGYSHIDLNHPGTVINLAIMMPWDIPPKMIPELREKARYEISDDCPTPMFTAKDISLQNIDGTDLFVVQLDATSPNGYLRKELPQCGAANNIALKPHIPKTTIDVKIWRDHEDCCKDTKDYKVCKAIKCLPTDDPNGIEPVTDAWTGLQVGYHYKVIGTTYTATCDNKPTSKPCSSNARRRSLLQDEYGNSGERL